MTGARHILKTCEDLIAANVDIRVHRHTRAFTPCRNDRRTAADPPKWPARTRRPHRSHRRPIHARSTPRILTDHTPPRLRHLPHRQPYARRNSGSSISSKVSPHSLLRHRDPQRRASAAATSPDQPDPHHQRTNSRRSSHSPSHPSQRGPGHPPPCRGNTCSSQYPPPTPPTTARPASSSLLPASPRSIWSSVSSPRLIDHAKIKVVTGSR